ncbi:MAG TPA: hypothetical protein VI911_08195 [Patescibacteria group bacterium]|nr:hypothetical protein [Patescibacteria group bacterium]
MYKNNFLVILKHNGKVLREIDGVVTVPFGSDYTIVLKNYDSRRAVVSVDIDGLSVLNGNQIVVPANDIVELQGALDNLSVNNKFRFIQKTKAISDFRGDRLDDGIVRVEYTFEKPSIPYRDFIKELSGFKSSYDVIGYRAGVAGASNTYSSSGITVKGTPTKQDFITTHTGILETQSYVITLKLQGCDEFKREVKTPIMTKTKKQCPSCGKRWKSYIKYCGSCGTFL